MIMNIQDLYKRMENVPPERLEAYHRMFDRIMLYTLAANLMDKQSIDQVIKNADKIIKKTIDADSQSRTDFLQNTKEGRVARMKEEADGEDVRLQFTEAWDIVKDLIRENLENNKED